jgi:hypothetical protein
LGIVCMLFAPINRTNRVFVLAAKECRLKSV